MKSFFSKVAGSLKVKRIPRAPCDCSDFMQAAPAAPTMEYLRDIVRVRQFGDAPEPTCVADRERRESVVRGTVFDLRNRCGAAGRCTCAGAPQCRFPSCFTMRPLTKGAEIQAIRLAYEIDDAPTAEIRALVQLAKEDKLEEAARGIKHLTSSLLLTAAAGRDLDRRLMSPAEEEYFPGSAKQGQDSSLNGVNPLAEDENFRQEVIDLFLWRAALLVTMRKDEIAVNSLINLASALEESQRTKLYAAAASWACLSDMEIIYYRSLLQQYQPFELAQQFASMRPLLLPRLFEALANDSYHSDYCTHIVFSKEVTCTVSRAQAAQMHGDLTEDPMRSLCLPLALHYYRFRVSEVFWKRFFALLCMPPVPPPTAEEKAAQAADPVAELGLTPNYILDAVGRSMMLHHLVIFADTRQKEMDNGTIVLRIKDLQNRKVQPHESDYAAVLGQGDMRIAITRMQQLLVVARTFEEEEQERLSGGAARPGAQQQQRFPTSSKAAQSSNAKQE